MGLSYIRTSGPSDNNIVKAPISKKNQARKTAVHGCLVLRLYSRYRSARGIKIFPEDAVLSLTKSFIAFIKVSGTGKPNSVIFCRMSMHSMRRACIDFIICKKHLKSTIYSTTAAVMLVGGALELHVRGCIRKVETLNRNRMFDCAKENPEFRPEKNESPGFC